MIPVRVVTFCGRSLAGDLRPCAVAWFILSGLIMLGLPATAEDKADDAGKDSGWDIENPAGVEWRDQSIDASEGTWISLDVSPDGETIVFDFLGDLYLMPVSGSSSANPPTKLTDGVAWDMQPRFSPDGREVAFTSDRPGKSGKAGDNIWVVNREDGILRQITDETYRLLNGPAWRPDGQYIVARKHFTSRRSLGSGEMWLYHRDGVDAKASGGLQLTSKPNDQKDVNEPVFSRDGRYLYYSQDSTPGSTFEYDKDSNGQIYTIKRFDLEKGETESAITGPGGACRPVPSPDGKTIAFVRRVGARTGLHLFDVASGSIRLLYDRLERDMQEAWAIHGVYPAFSWMPDGGSIVLYAKGKIRRIEVADGSESIIPFHIKDTRKVAPALRFPIEAAPDECQAKMLRWVATSPRGDQVVYQALGHLYVRDLPEGTPRRLTDQDDHFEFYPSYSRDGRYIVYTTWNDEQLGSIRVAGARPGPDQERWTVTEEPGHYLEPVFSPSGETIVFRKEGGGYLVSHLWSRDQGLYRIPARGGEWERLSESGVRPQFADGEERVFFLREKSDKDADNLGLYSIDLQHGFEERQHYTSSWATDYQISPDGNRIAFIERFHVYVAPFVQTGQAISVGPNATNLPVVKVSREAGDWIHFSGDSGKLHWGLGATYYSIDLREVFAAAREGEKETETEAAKPSEIAIGFTFPHDKPEGRIALVGGRMVTMNEGSVIDDGVILVNGNRIEAVGARGEVEIPEETKVIDVTGQVILPGFIDTHAHGPQASHGITPQQSWVDFARLAFGVTTIHDPSNNTHDIFAAGELTKAGGITAPRTYSTGTILYGATGSFKAEIDSLDDARFHLRRMQAVGAFTVKSYNQPRRDQRQQVLTAARELGMMVVPEGGSTFMHNMTMIVDGHTGIEHTLSVQYAYDDVLDLWRNTGVGYTPTLSVAYGGLSGERYWYAHDDLWEHQRLQTFIPPHLLYPRSRRREIAPLEDYNHIKVASITKQLVDQGNLVQAGGHGQLNGICTHWEMWSFVQGGMTPMEALHSGTLHGARYLGLDRDLGSLEAGKLADLTVFSKDADPTKDIRQSEAIHYVMANGRLFEAATMNPVGDDAPARKPFYWKGQFPAIGITPDMIRGAGCEGCRAGLAN